MSAHNWETVKELFSSALELQPEQRADFLEQACAGNHAQRAEIEWLLASFSRADDFLETPAVDDAIKLFNENRSKSAAGRRIGQYEIIREIGQGGMGAVYLAARADDQYKKQVAIKLVRQGFDIDFIVNRFLAERQILANLDHPNIARLLDGGTTEDGSPYLVMEYIDGSPLDEYCDRQKLSIVERLKLFQTVCSAVGYAHRNLVIHRDIKPSNILVTDEGTPKLLDFGIAKILLPETAVQATDKTAATLRLMTPDYASPEQIKGETITTLSDIYSLGVLLYKLLTGLRPYRLKTTVPGEIESAICEQPPEKPSEAARGRLGDRVTQDRATNPQSQILNPKLLRGDLDNIVLMSIRKQPSRRYSSAEQLAEDIRRHLVGLPVIARADTFAYRSAKFVERHKVGVLAAALIVVSLLSAVVMTVREERKAQRRFNDVRKLANSVIFEFHDSIQDLPGSTPARELLVNRALEYLDSLSREAGDDPSLQRELIAAYLRVGNVQGNPNNANLGDSAGAMQSYRKALAIAQRLAARNSRDADARHSLAVIHQKMGDTQSGTGDIDGAVESLQKSLAIFRDLAEAAPANVEAQQSLAVSYVKLGDVLGNSNFPNRGDSAEAMQSYRLSLAILQSLYSSDAKLFRTRRLLGLIYERIGSILEDEGNFAQALDTYRRSLAIREPLAADYPTNTDAVRDAAIAHEKIANVLTSTGELAAALENRRKSLDTFTGLAKADPRNVQAQRSLAISYIHMGDLLGDPDSPNLARRAEALENYEPALHILQSKESDPTNADTRHMLRARS